MDYAPASLPLTAVVASGALPYLSEPKIVQTNDGAFYCFYRKGSAHVSNDGGIYGKRSADQGATWGPEISIYKHPSWDTRNHAGGVDPVSGRLIVFFRTYDAVAPAHKGLHFVTSMDHGLTWTAPIDVSALVADITANGFAFFGHIAQTVNGLAIALSTASAAGNRQIAWIIYSTDGGLTWGSRMPIYDVVQTVNVFSEPYIVRLDASRLVALVRDNTNGTRYASFTTSDGGLSWIANPSGMQPWTLDTITYPSPMAGVKLDENEVLIAWTSRIESGPNQSVLYLSRLNAEAFFRRPSWAWEIGANPHTRLWLSPVKNGTPYVPYTEFGYPSMLKAANGVPYIAWYDSVDGLSPVQTNILIQAIKR